MFRDRFRIILIVAVLIAAISAWGAYRIIADMRTSSRVITRSVVVAAQDISEGASLTSNSLALAELPVAAIPAGAFSETDSVVERVARVPIFKGEAIVPGRLAPIGTTPGIEVKISPGKRAMAVRIDDVTGLSGLMQPNSRVDVLVTLREESGNTGRISKLFMSNMRVLSVGSQVERAADGTARPSRQPRPCWRSPPMRRSGSRSRCVKGAFSWCSAAMVTRILFAPREHVLPMYLASSGAARPPARR
jgi:Flp pilus assembly protein CpaB